MDRGPVARVGYADGAMTGGIREAKRLLETASVRLECVQDVVQPRGPGRTDPPTGADKTHVRPVGGRGRERQWLTNLADSAMSVTSWMSASET